jgi:Acyl-CoA carboxylase epsilon subunit
VNEEDGPLLRVVRGHPSDAELAALTVVLSAKLAARGNAGDRGNDGDRGTAGGPGQRGWPDRAVLLRAPLITGPDAWRHSARPR